MRAFETRGYRIQWLQSGQSARDYFNRFSPSLNLNETSDQEVRPTIKTVLLDPDLPDVNAIELVAQLDVEGQPDTPIVALIHQDDQIEVLRSQGVTDYVTLPCDATAVIAHIRRYLTRDAPHYINS